MGRGRRPQYPDRMELRIPAGWREDLADLAERNGRPVSAEVRAALAAHIGEADPDPPRRDVVRDVRDADAEPVFAEYPPDLTDLDPW